LFICYGCSFSSYHGLRYAGRQKSLGTSNKLTLLLDFVLFIGILIVGPPGCGKRTCLASIMQHLKWNCVAISLTGPCIDDQELQRILNRQNSSVGLVIWLQVCEVIFCFFLPIYTNWIQRSRTDLDMVFDGTLLGFRGMAQARPRGFR